MSSNSLRGQWLGPYVGSHTNGELMVNIDKVDGQFEGVAYVLANTDTVPTILATFSIPDNTFETTAKLEPIDRSLGYLLSKDNLTSQFPKTIFAEEAKIFFTLTKHKLTLKATYGNDQTLDAQLNRSAGIEQSKILGKKMSWTEFKSEVDKFSQKTYLFRGQQKPWALCTAFHRRERYRISEFVSKDVKKLHQKISAITPHYFDLSQPEQNGAFFHLLQHHGYPTPLLDWSYSPYVAAFFAFRNVPVDSTNTEDKIRIYIFDEPSWVAKTPQRQNIDPPFPHLSVIEAIAINNPRAIPQQAVTTASNLYDIESYILQKEEEQSPQNHFLTAIDIPAAERETAMRDLRLMGITAASMFPGIDGICEEFREINFDK